MVSIQDSAQMEILYLGICHFELRYYVICDNKSNSLYTILVKCLNTFI